MAETDISRRYQNGRKTNPDAGKEILKQFICAMTALGTEPHCKKGQRQNKEIKGSLMMYCRKISAFCPLFHPYSVHDFLLEKKSVYTTLEVRK